KLLEQTMERAGEKGERASVAGEETLDGARIVARDRGPRGATECRLCRIDGATGRQQRRELFRAELPQSVKGHHAGKLPDADEAERRLRRAAREPVELAREQDLVVEVVLEPERHIAAGDRALESRVPSLAHRDRISI